MQRIYLDYNASTPVAPEVVAAMQPFLAEHFGNPSSLHWAGAPAKVALEKARAQAALLLGCASDEIIFTSGGTEASNAAIKGVWFAKNIVGGRIVTTAVEHPATLKPCEFLKKLGADLVVLPVDGTGRVDPDAVRKALTPKTVLVSVMHAQNEVGTLQPIAQIGRLCREKQILFHTDAAQSVGKLPTLVDELNVDLLTVAGHKLCAPKGVGLLYVRKGVTLEPFVHGAGHESGRRAGTENVLLNVGLGEACELAGSFLALPASTAGSCGYIQNLRDRLWQGLHEKLGARVRLHGHPELRLPNTLNVGFVNQSGAAVLAAWPGVAASTGSACHAGRVTLSAVLQAMNVPPESGMGAIRFSLGRWTTQADIDAVVALAGT